MSLDTQAPATRLFVGADLGVGAKVDLTPQQAHYLGRVLRLTAGARVALFNGRHGEWLARIERVRRGVAGLDIERQSRPQSAADGPWLVFAPIKRGRIDILAEKATELGAQRLVPVITARTVVKRVNVGRLRAHAVGAAEQCRRLDVPEVDAPRGLDAVLAEWPAGRRLLVLDESGAGAPIARLLAAPGGALGDAFLVGPEGGFEASELDAVRQLPFVGTVDLGERILRADTAALAALACWQALAAASRPQPETHAMPDESLPGAEPITDKRRLVEYLEAGCKPPADWRIGTEHEKFAYRQDDLRPLPYEGEAGIRALLDGLTRFGWRPVLEDGKPVALTKPDHSSITLEPAGQLELAGAPLETVHGTCHEVGEHLGQVKELAAELGIGFLGTGYNPKWSLADMPWMPKGRYAIMRRYMPTRGALGLEMMQASCTVQVNLDFDSEATMVQMFRIGLALQPVATALWANSPFKEGKPSGFLSYRSHVWTDTDPDRCGILPFVFDDGFGFERYVDYMLDVPMYFVSRGGAYVDVAGRSFRHFMAGKLDELPGEYPHMGDWIDHLTTAFPEVRLKQFLEMRGADGGPWSRLCALPAFWVGLLYDDAARDAAWDLVASWTPDEHALLRDQVPRHALATPFRDGTIGDVACRVLAIAHDGLCRRARKDKVGLDETHFLNPLFQIAESAFTPAEELLAAFDARWHGDVDPVFREYAY